MKNLGVRIQVSSLCFYQGTRNVPATSSPAPEWSLRLFQWKRDTSLAAIYETWTDTFQTSSVHQLFNTAFQCLLLTPHQYFHWLNELNKQDKAPQSFLQSLWLLYDSVLEMSMLACLAKGASLVLVQAGGAQRCRQNHELVSQEWWGPQNCRERHLSPSLRKSGGRTVTHQVRQKCCNLKAAKRRRTWQKCFFTLSKTF